MSQGTAVTVNNINLVSLSGDITGNTIDGYVSSISGPSPVIVTPNSLQWLSSVTSPTLTQASSANPGQNLTIQAQGTGGGGAGGNLILASGTSLFGSAGNIIFQLGATTGLTLLSTGTLQFPATATATINQAASTGGATNLSITAQSAGGAGDNGGALVLTSGASTTTGTSGNVIINTATPGGGTAGNILFQVSGTTQAFVNSFGVGIGSTPGTSPTITSGSGVPTSTQPTGSLYLNTSGSTITGVYTRTTSWLPINAYTGLIAPITATTNTNTVAVYTVDSTSGNDGVILHFHTGPTTYVMPSPAPGRQIIIRDITGAIETTNQTGGYVTGSGATSNVIFVAPHGTESFNGSAGYILTGGSTFHVTNNSAAVTCSTGLFTTELAPGMSITFGAQSGVSYVISSIGSATSLTLTSVYTGTTSTTSSATMNSLAYYANWGTLTLTSDGTNWFATSNKPMRVYLTANGTFIPSPGCTAAYLVGCGGGGGGAGGGGTSTSGGGGGGGALQSIMITTLTPNIASGYTVVIGAGGTGGVANSAGTTGNPGNNTSFGTLAYFYGASGGSSSGGLFNSPGGLFFTNSGTNMYSSSSAAVGTGSASLAAATTQLQGSTSPGSIAMGGSGGANSISGVAGMINTSSNLATAYVAGTGGGSNGGGGGGAGPQGNGGNAGAASSVGSSASANTGAGGGGGGILASTGTAGGNGGSGYLYVYTWM